MFTMFLGRREFAASHEARVAQVAREMAESGWPLGAGKVEVPAAHLVRKQGILRLAADIDAPPLHVNPWIVPVLNGQIRLQKPPLPYWGAAIVYRIFGVSEATSRLVPALLGVLATLLLFDLARVLYNYRVAWVATVIWLTMYLVAEQYRLAMADPYLAFFTLASIWAWIKACLPNSTRCRECEAPAEPDAPGSRDTGSAGASHSRFIVLFYISLALGALSKGPLIFLHTLIPLVLFHLCFRRGLPRGWRAHTLGVLVFVAIALPWPMAVLKQVSNATELWRYESVGEVSGENQENVREWWYYAINLPLMAAPWIPLWMFAVAYPLLRNRSRWFFPLLWYLITIGFFSIAGQKKLPYLLPMMPAQALMLGVATVPLLRLAVRARMGGLPGTIIVIQSLIAVAWAITLLFLARSAHSLTVTAMLLSGLALVFAVYSMREMHAVRPVKWLAYQTVSYAFVLLGFGAFYLTPINNARSPAPAVREMVQMADGYHTAILQSRMPEEASFYLPLHPKTGPAPSVYLVILDDHVEVDRRARAKHPVPIPPPDRELFQSWFPNAKVIAARRIELQTAPGDARWKAYEITINRTAYAIVP
ncbi:MAG TPA: glycosyltransferase family 39 protein [Tepidisphaeraceae bacterium]